MVFRNLYRFSHFKKIIVSQRQDGLIEAVISVIIIHFSILFPDGLIEK